MAHKLKIVDDIECPFTPGPWVVREGLAIPFWIDAPKSKRSICEVDKQGFVPDAPQSHTRANASLIAAAPDMLEALLNLENDDGKAMPRSAWKMVQNAIRAARP